MNKPKNQKKRTGVKCNDFMPDNILTSLELGGNRK
jgi:hypothetical protein